MGYNTNPMAQPTRRGCLLSLQSVLRLTASDRQWLNRIAKGRGGRRRPPGWKRERARTLLKCDEGSEGEGWPDEAIAAALDVSARSMSRWRRQAVEAGPRRWRASPRCRAVPPAGRRGRSATPAAGPVHAAGRPGAGRCGRWPASWWRGGLRPASATRRCAACSKKRTDALVAGATGLSAGVAGGGLRDPEGNGAEPLPPALRCALSGDRQG